MTYFRCHYVNALSRILISRVKFKILWHEGMNITLLSTYGESQTSCKKESFSSCLFWDRGGHRGVQAACHKVRGRRCVWVSEEVAPSRSWRKIRSVRIALWKTANASLAPGMCKCPDRSLFSSPAHSCAPAAAWSSDTIAPSFSLLRWGLLPTTESEYVRSCDLRVLRCTRHYR